MTAFLLYLLKSAACLTAFYLLYKWLLSRDTLHRMNRVLLTGMLVLALVLPLCVITVTRELPPMPSPSVPEMPFDLPVAVGEITPVALPAAPAEAPFDWMKLLAVLYMTGLLAVLAWTGMSILKVVLAIRGGRKVSLEGGKTLVLTQKPVVPFSWMKYVVICEADWERGGSTILLHEQAHLRMGHSWDLLAIDLLGSLQWFNPTMWLLRRELRAVHEYEADEAVLRTGTNAKDYQLLLLKKAVGKRWYSIANSLHHSNLKNRIAMMSQKRSSRWARAKALYVLPIVCLSLGAFARTVYVTPDPLPEKVDEIFGGKTHVAHTETGVSGWKGAMEVSVDNDSLTMICVTTEGNPSGALLAASKKVEEETPVEAISGYTDPHNSHVRMTVDTLSVINSPVFIMSAAKVSGQKVYVKNTRFADIGDPPYLFMIDGEPSDAAHFNALSKDDFVSINVLKGNSAVEKYGERAKDGVIEVTTKRELQVAFMHGTSIHDRRSGVTRIKDTGNGFAIHPNEGMRPLVLVDGVPTDISFLDPIDADAVGYVQVIHPGAETLKTYGEAARDGVIRIVTKKGAKQLTKRALKPEFLHGKVRHLDLAGSMYSIKEAENGRLAIRLNDGMQPLILLGDERKDISYLNSIDADSIFMIFVYQPDSKALRLPSWFSRYGEATRDGVIYFQTLKDMRQLSDSMEADLQRRIEAASGEDRESV